MIIALGAAQNTISNKSVVSLFRKLIRKGKEQVIVLSNVNMKVAEE